MIDQVSNLVGLPLAALLLAVTQCFRDSSLRADFDTLKAAHFDSCKWPTSQTRSILLKRQEARMERKAKVELFEEIRREYEFGDGTVLGVAHKLGVHRRMVRQALANARTAGARKR